MSTQGFDAEAFAAVLRDVQESIKQREELAHSTTPEACTEVDRALQRCDRAMRELRASLKALPPAILVGGGEEDVLEFIWGVDQASKGFRRARSAWQLRNPHRR